MKTSFRPVQSLLCGALIALGGASPAALAAPLDNVTAVTAGSTHTCALRSTDVVCWGWNAFGQLGIGTFTNTPSPTPGQPVPGLGGTPSAISAGEFHTCALTAAGGVKCWGRNGQGQLGDGTWTDRITPVDVVGHTSGVAKISAGYDNTCVVTTSGAVSCWGVGGAGHAPIASGAVDVKTGYSHACALTAGGGVKCWGQNSLGQLGDGTFTPSNAPRDVVGLASGVAAIAVGVNHSCALTTAGGVKCWGSNQGMQMGTPFVPTGSVNTPMDIQGQTSGRVAISANSLHMCSVTTAGAVWCWGDNPYGQVGHGLLIMIPGPTEVSGLSSGAASVAAGVNHTCAVRTNGQVLCWGNNDFGQVGIGTTGGNVLQPSTVLVLAPNTITFADIPDANVASSPLTVTATASSGLPVDIASIAAAGGPQVCWTSGMTVTFSSPGVCTLSATQTGDVDYMPATPVIRSFIVFDAGAIAVPRLVNISTRVKVVSGTEGVGIAGFAVKGPARKTVVIRAMGPSLASAGLTQLLNDPRLTLHSSNGVVLTNDSWRSGASYGGGTEVPTLQALGFAPTDDREAAVIVTLDQGLYTVVVDSSAPGSVGIASIEVFEIDPPQSPLINIATRGQVDLGNDVMIAGFIIEGNNPQTVVVTAAGPSLGPAGIANPLANPFLVLVRQSDNMAIASNDNWQTQNNPADLSAILASGIVPQHPLESAIIMTLPPGAYTAVMYGVGNTTGIGLVGVYAVPQ
ncbi:RCC1 domain-containing protein [Usitatibacter palustris]|uniref:Alpha-tubulin suppressor n=1 Tax=Usitatibacter palustris TaxID=2732487 RepID=A0A6M4HCR8_9PROT|nr:RCC1 domain-containing protein [Usitatibacter palustris]QJR16528.1 hypothetical protein DSM104440_03363 [Usitatibacter palustris]